MISPSRPLKHMTKVASISFESSGFGGIPEASLSYESAMGVKFCFELIVDDDDTQPAKIIGSSNIISRFRFCVILISPYSIGIMPILHLNTRLSYSVILV